MDKVKIKMNILEQIVDPSAPILDSEYLSDQTLVAYFWDDLQEYIPGKVGFLNKISQEHLLEYIASDLIKEEEFCDLVNHPDMSFLKLSIILKSMPFDLAWPCLLRLESEPYPGFRRLLDRVMGVHQVIDGMMIQDVSAQATAKNVVDELLESLEKADAKWDEFAYFVYSARIYLKDRLTAQIQQTLSQKSAFFSEHRNGFKDKVAIYQSIKLGYLIWVSEYDDDAIRQNLAHMIAMTICKIPNQAAILHCYPLPLIKDLMMTFLDWAKQKDGHRTRLAQAVIDEIKSNLKNPKQYKYQKILRKYDISINNQVGDQ